MNKTFQIQAAELKLGGAILACGEAILSLQELGDEDAMQFMIDTKEGLRFYLDAWRIKNKGGLPLTRPD